MTYQRGPVDALFQGTDVGRQRFWQHRYDPVGEVDAVAALIGFAVELTA